MKSSVQAFSDEALLAELGDEDGVSEADAVDAGSESLEALERRLRAELASMPDSSCDEEAAIRAEIEAMSDEPDEGTALYVSLMRDEKTRLARRRAEERDASRESIAPSMRGGRADRDEDEDEDELARLRNQGLEEKMEAVRLKRAGDVDGARAALRRWKAIAARLEKLENAAASPETTLENVSRQIKDLKLEAVRLNRAGDREAARAALSRAKETQAALDRRISPSAAADTAADIDPGDRRESPDPFVFEPDARSSAHLAALMDAARAAMSRSVEEDPETSPPARSADRRADADLSARELGEELEDAHFSGAYDGRDANGLARDFDAFEVARARKEELEVEILGTKRKALAAKRNGEIPAARDFLRTAKALTEELRELRDAYGLNEYSVRCGT
jgi:hypothetical protein